MVGTMTVYRSELHGTADVGVMVGDTRVWGKGVGLDAFGTVLSALEGSGLIRKITAGTLAFNVGMVKIMERSGMRHEATRSAQELLNGQPADIVYYAKFCHS
jgi:RimJ/RimL family protein N-acetyltransferase